LLEKITSEELSDVAREVFGNGNISKLYYL
jgi:hypothetical protein